MPRMHWNWVKSLRPRPQRALQFMAAALFNGYALGFQKGRIFTGKTKALCVPVLNCYSCPGALGACPIGSLQAALGTQGRRFPFYILGTLMLFGVLLGRGVCGLLCPFGLVQDLLHKIPLPKWRVPKKIDQGGRWVKYLVLLGMVLVLPALATGVAGAAIPYFCKYLCPAGTLEGGVPLLISNPSLRQAMGGLFTWKLLVLVLILAASVGIHRPFCKYLCPLGAFYSLFNRLSLYRMNLDKGKCVGCKACESSCPMGVSVTKNINSTECIRCGKCNAQCPAGAITSGFLPEKQQENNRQETQG